MEAPRWLDGRLVPAGEVLPELAPGAFETLRCEHGRVFLVEEHLARLERGARALGLGWPPPFAPRVALDELARVLGPNEHAVRLAWRPPHLVLEARAPTRPPAELRMRLGEPGALALPRPFGVKTTERAGYDAARTAARAAGCFDVLVRASDGTVVEGTAANVFVAARGELLTPPLASGALPGIVRALILDELARVPLVDETGHTWRAREAPVRAPELGAAREVLLTSSLVRVVGVDRLEGLSAAPRLPGARGTLARALLARVTACEARSQRAPAG
jgi:branched-subunit amino acid aminotransferase/4-amino-4-deoxychorismate lyase